MEWHKTMKEKKKNKIHIKIRNKLKFFIVMFFIFLGLSVYFVIKDAVPLKYPLSVFLIGLFIGGLLSRIQNITWDNNGEQIVKEFDIISGILLFFLILLIIFKQQLIHKFVHLPKISAIVFALNTGIMFGRTWLIRRQIKKILLEH